MKKSSHQPWTTLSYWWHGRKVIEYLRNNYKNSASVTSFITLEHIWIVQDPQVFYVEISTAKTKVLAVQGMSSNTQNLLNFKSIEQVITCKYLHESMFAKIFYYCTPKSKRRVVHTKGKHRSWNSLVKLPFDWWPLCKSCDFKQSFNWIF